MDGRRVGKEKNRKIKAPEELAWSKVPRLHGEGDRLPGADVECDGEAALLLLLLHPQVQGTGAGGVANLHHHLLHVLFTRLISHLVQVDI